MRSLDTIEDAKSLMKTGFERAKRTVWRCGRLLLAALLLLSAIALGQTQPPALAICWL